MISKMIIYPKIKQYNKEKNYFYLKKNNKNI